MEHPWNDWEEILVGRGRYRALLLQAIARPSSWRANLFVRKRLAIFQERKVKPRRANDATRWSMAILGLRSKEDGDNETSLLLPNRSQIVERRL